MVRIIIGAILVLLYILALLTPARDAKDEANRAQFPIAGGVLMLLPGLILGAWGYRSLKKRSAARNQNTVPIGHSPEIEGPRHVAVESSDSPTWTASCVLVVGKTKLVDGVYKQVEDRLVRTIAAQPRIPLTTQVSIDTLRTEDLPANTRQALEPTIWALQHRFNKRGGRWQVDFYDPAGYSFMVVYLE